MTRNEQAASAYNRVYLGASRPSQLPAVNRIGKKKNPEEISFLYTHIS